MTAIPLTAAPDSSYAQNVRLSRIALPEDHKCTRPDANGYCRCTVRTGGDILRGSVEVLAPSNRSFNIEVRLEGICRTWIPNGDPTTPPSDLAEINFLRETETVDYRPPAVETSERIRAHQLDFNFRIPRRLISTRSDVNPRFLELYPSAQMGSSCRAYAARQQYMQPLIFYRIIAMIPKSAKNVYAQAYLRDWYCERVIKIIPTKVADPPLYVRAYPDEYRLESSVKLRSRLYSPSIGELRISAEEPVPFNLAAPTPRASTGVPLKLSISANDSFMSSKEPYNWTVTVQTRVLLRTFHSTRALNYEPTLQDLMSDHLAMRMESTKEEIRYYTGLQWGVDQLPKGTAVRQSEMLRPPLTSKLYVTVSLPKSSVPSFLTPLAALRYSVILKTTVVGTKSSPATVEVPVQVHRCPVTASSEGPRDGNQQMSGYPRPRNSNSFWEDESDDIVEGTTSQLDEQLPRYR